MKIFFSKLFFSIAFLIACQWSYSQTISLNKENISIRDVFKEIENQSEMSFMFSDDLSGLNEKVTVKANNEKINDILDYLFAKTNLGYRILDEKLIVVAPKAVIGQKTVEGTVTDSKGEKLIGVTVTVKGTAIGTITDVEGNYTIEALDNNSILTFSYIGYEMQEIPVGQLTIIAVTMKEADIHVGEVVVVGYGTALKKSLFDRCHFHFTGK